MKSLRVRFAIGFSVLCSLILGTAFFIVYISYADFRKDEFYNRLKDRALTTYRLLVEVEQVDRDLLAVIDRNTLNSLYEEKVLIFEDDQLIYSSIDDKTIRYDSKLLEKVRTEKEIHSRQGDDELLAVSFEQNKKTYTLLALAFDKGGKRKALFLKWVLIIVYSSGMLVGWAATYLFVKRVIQPLENLTKNIRDINPDNLAIKLREDNNIPEVDSLAANFNQMLERLRKSFAFQKDFVNYVSHELGTPLTAMIGLTENALAEKMDAPRQREMINRIYKQQQNLAAITNSLMILSKVGRVGQAKFPIIRLDELLMRSAEIMQDQFPGSKIELNINASGIQDDFLCIPADEPLLQMAFNNLIKNAIQYSPDHLVQAEILLKDKQTFVEFHNKGLPLSPEEEARIFDPFFRGFNAIHKKGYGLGLSLVLQIAELHKAKIIYSRREDRNVFCLIFG